MLITFTYYYVFKINISYKEVQINNIYIILKIIQNKY